MIYVVCERNRVVRLKKSSPVSLNILQGNFRIEIFSKQYSGSQIGTDLEAVFFHVSFPFSLSFVYVFVSFFTFFYSRH